MTQVVSGQDELLIVEVLSMVLGLAWLDHQANRPGAWETRIGAVPTDLRTIL